MQEPIFKPRVSIPFSLLPEGRYWKVGQTYRAKLVLRQVGTGEQDAMYEIVDASSLEVGDASKSRFLRSEGGYVKI